MYNFEMRVSYTARIFTGRVEQLGVKARNGKERLPASSPVCKPGAPVELHFYSTCLNIQYTTVRHIHSIYQE